MKLNFWQWIGVVVVVVGVALLIYRETRPAAPPADPGTAPVVQPTR
jgi:drug/metabolite transporter (DMT)-like permease